MKEIDQTQLVLDILSSKWATRIVRTLYEYFWQNIIRPD